MLRLATIVSDIPSALNPPIGRWRLSSTKTEQGLKSGHRIPPTIVPKHELIQVDLKLRITDTVVSANQPLLHVPDRAIRKRHHRGYAFTQVGP